MTTLTIGLQIALLVLSLLLILLVLLHKGRGGGMSDMFGGGITSSLGSSGVAERNLTRLTIVLGIVWGLIIVALALIIQTVGSW
ncbi:preprotein translocase subunit SecG [Nesterenkonia ebinurensis]|uniref:preprotein translocase subunit SecG n=1 Tax=Nesterenkonia ebinurensis TaxID=2608252 RepID=UPI00123E1F84|nr:preprotein translocase subunit SecG [Nesterenkonia ebinurensis]